MNSSYRDTCRAERSQSTSCRTFGGRSERTESFVLRRMNGMTCNELPDAQLPKGLALCVHGRSTIQCPLQGRDCCLLVKSFHGKEATLGIL